MKEFEEGDMIVVKRPNTDRSEGIEIYNIDLIGDDGLVDLLHFEKTRIYDGEKERVRKTIHADVLEQGIDDHRIALLKDPLEVLYYV